MPKGAHLKKEHDLKRVKSILLRFTQHEFIQLQNYCKGLGIERSEMVREAVFKAIDFHQQAKETQQEKHIEKIAVSLPAEKAEKSPQDFLEDLVHIYLEFCKKNSFDRKIDCNIYRATITEFTNLLTDYSQKALTEEFWRYCQGLLMADFFNSHLFRGFEIHISNSFVFWNKHNRGSSNYIGY
ncbi:MAG: hypothetical protein V4714_07860 [Bacteroidota bacterium]